jgi:hypothetical protein
VVQEWITEYNEDRRGNDPQYTPSLVFFGEETPGKQHHDPEGGAQDEQHQFGQDKKHLLVLR